MRPSWFVQISASDALAVRAAREPDRTPEAVRAAARVLYVSHVVELGGAERSLLDLVESLDRTRFSAHVALPRPGPLQTAVERAGAVVWLCPALGRLQRRWSSPVALARSGWRLIVAQRALAEIVREHRIDLVHANSLTSALFATVGPARLSCPVLSHLRDLRGGGIARGWLRHRVQCIVAPSESCGAEVPGSFIRIIPNGIRLEARESPARAPHVFQILTVANLVPWKGHDRLIEAAALVCARRADARFQIVGTDLFDDHGAWVRSLHERVDAMGLSGRVEFLGQREDVPALLGRADLLVHPAFPEPFGRIVVEALAQECPVLAFAGDHGPAEILRDGIGGRLVSPRSSEALARAILELADQPEVLRSLARGARAKAVARFDRDTMSRRMERLYEDLLARARRSR